MERFARIVSLLALALAITACHAAPPAAQVDPAAVGAARFPGADAILAGFDPAQPGADWRAGDRLLYGLSTESGTKRSAKLVEIELLEPQTYQVENEPDIVLRGQESVRLKIKVGNNTLEWSSARLRVAVRVYGADGQLEQQTETKVPETALRSGIHPALELISELEERVERGGGAPVEVSEPETRIIGEAMAMLPTLLELLQDDGVLESLLKQVVGPPPLLSLFRGIDVTAVVGLHEASLVTDPVAPPCARGTIYRLPVRLDVNDDPELDLELAVATPDPPLRLSGGILSLSGAGRGGRKRSVTFELLAARRGAPGAEIRL